MVSGPPWNLNDEIYLYSEYRNNPGMMKTGITIASMSGITELVYTYEEMTMPE